MEEAITIVGRYMMLSTINFHKHILSITHNLEDLSERCYLILKGQMLTVIEYTLLLYRALLPAPVWYRFFLNKDNGSLFSSLTTGLYLTFKLTSVVEKVSQIYSKLLYWKIVI